VTPGQGSALGAGPAFRTVQGGLLIWRRVLLCVLGIGALGPAASAEEAEAKQPPITRFLTAEACYLESKGEVEISSAFDYRRPGGDWTVPVTIEYGITDRIEAEIEASYASVLGGGTRHRGPRDVELGLSYALRPDVSLVALTLGVGVRLPTGDETRGLGSGETDVEFSGILGLGLGRAELHLTGMLDVGDETEPALNAAAVVPQGNLRFTLEANLRRTEAAGGGEENDDPWIVATPGLFHRPTPEIEYGFGVPIGLTGSAPDWGIIARTTIEF